MQIPVELDRGYFVQDIISIHGFLSSAQGVAKKLRPREDPDEGLEFWEERSSGSEG